MGIGGDMDLAPLGITLSVMADHLLADPPRPAPGSGRHRRRLRALRRGTLTAAVTVAVLAAGVASPPAVTPAAADPEAAGVSTAAVDARLMRPSRVTAAQMERWFRSRINYPEGWKATVNLNTLTRLFIEEGNLEGVAGDLAFIQSIIETGWFRFTGVVPGDANNFGGIGAIDSAPERFNRFTTARMGVRGQIHHLRAYADPNVTTRNLATPNASPRFHLVVPKGRAPWWSMMGNGNWATDPNYATKILGLYDSMLRHAGVANPGPPLRVFSDVPPDAWFANAVRWARDRGVTNGVGNTGRFEPGRSINRAEVATMLWRVAGQPATPGGQPFRDVPTGTWFDSPVRYLAGSGITTGFGGTSRFEPNGTTTRSQAVTMLWRLAGSPPRSSSPFADVRAGNWFSEAVAWARAHNITTGVGGSNRFEPDRPVTRAEFVAFIQRSVATPAAWTAPLPPVR